MWRRLVATALTTAVVSIGLVTLQASPAQAATSYNSRCGNTSGRVLLTFDDWAYGDPYRATRIGAYLQSRNIRAMFFLIKSTRRNTRVSFRRAGSRALGTQPHLVTPQPHAVVGCRSELADPLSHQEQPAAS